MNSITFYVDVNDYVFKCEYYERINQEKIESINLPKEKLRNIFFEFVKKYPNGTQRMNEKYSTFTFFDVDVLEIDKLIAESKKYNNNNLKPVSIETKSFSTPITSTQNNKKIKRVNKFKGKIIMTTASVLLSLALFAIAKESIQQLNIDSFPTFSLSDEFVESIKNEFERDKITVDNNTDITSQKTVILPMKEEPKIEDVIGKDEVEEMEKISNDNLKENSIIPDTYLKISTDNLVNEGKYNLAKAYYFDSLSQIANRYGVDPNLALAIGIHERGIHSDSVDSGGAVGLFQIQVEGGWNWDNRTITAYNFETNQYEDVLITKDSVSDVFENMRVGCMMMQNLLTTYNYNIAEAVTAYNYGTENVRHVLECCSEETGLSKDELNNINNIEWLKYRDIIKGGDPEYLENVFKYIPDGTILSFARPNQENINIQFDNLSYQNNKVM